MKKSKLFFVMILVVVMIGFVMTGCKKTAEDDGIVKIGLSFSDFATERWPVEQALMTQLAYDKGAQVVSQVANHDAKLQNDQIENMVLQGVDVIIIIAEDGAACATAVDQAAEAGVKVIAYDRLIKSPKLAAYISFDNVEVGRTQARGVLKERDSGNFVLLGGSPTDNNAVLFRQGQLEILQPLIDSGKINVVADQWVDNWDPANALKIMENILTAQKNNIDAVVASNDGTALGALQAMKAQGLAGNVPISGQDATAAGCKSIVEGELTMSVLKDVRELTPLAINMAIDLAKGKTIAGLKNFTLAELTLDENLKGEVPCKFLQVISVDQANVYDEVVKSGFQKYDEIYKDIPVAQRPPRP
ncbi:MAG: substrate-binding domain-containing protein [Spirochaetes bacterium]|nr:substrate-binding domain-containing protein [Spirochaetota bacterium]